MLGARTGKCASNQPGSIPMTKPHPGPNNSSSSDDHGQFNHWHIDPKSGDGQSSPGESFYLDQPLAPTPNWILPKTFEEIELMVEQLKNWMNYANIKNPNIKSLMDLMDYHESLEIELHKMKLERSARLEYDLTQNQFDGFIASGQKFKKNHEVLLQGLWPRKGLCLMFAPPSFGKTLVTFELMKRLELPGECILYCGADEDEEGIEKN